MVKKRIIKFAICLLLLVVFLLIINKCSYIQINVSSIENYERIYGKYGIIKNKYIGYNDIFPDTIINKKNVKKFKTKSNLAGCSIVGYLVIEYDEDDYNNEKNRLHSLTSDKKIDHYGIESSEKELCAIYSDYKGVIYALADDSLFEISYIDIQFDVYHSEIDYTEIIPQNDLPIGFNALYGNSARDDFWNTNYESDENNDFYYLYDDTNNELLISLIPKEGYTKSSFYFLYDLYIQYDNNVEIITFEKGTEKFHPYTMSCAFYNKNLKKINGFENIDTSNVIYFDRCFEDCNCIDDSILKSLKTDSGKSFSSMFAGSNSISYFDSSNYDFSNAEILSGMFEGCINLKEVDFSNTNFRNVYTTCYLFNSCPNLTKVDFSNSNFINCLYIDDMFSRCKSLKEIDFDNVVMFNIERLDGLFKSCSSLSEIDLSDLDFNILEKRSVTKKDYLSKDDFDGIFKNCSKLIKIYLPRSFKKNFFEYDLDFLRCDSLEGIYYKDGDNIELIKSFKK